LLENMLVDSPSDSFLLFAIAKEHEKSQNTSEALKIYSKLKEIDPDYVGLYYHFGKLLEKETQIEQAIVIYNEGIFIAKKINNQHAWSELAAAKMNLVDED
jgi:tetratricopeptide (TPR) repeat protein